MRVGLAVAFLFPGSLLAQQMGTVPGGAKVEIRSADSLRVIEVRVNVGGGLFDRLGVLRPAPGRVDCARNECTATTPAELSLTGHSGEVRIAARDSLAQLEITVISLQSPVRRLVARGNWVSFDRSDRGNLIIRAAEISF